MNSNGEASRIIYQNLTEKDMEIKRGWIEEGGYEISAKERN